MFRQTRIGSCLSAGSIFSLKAQLPKLFGFSLALMHDVGDFRESFCFCTFAQDAPVGGPESTRDGLSDPEVLVFFGLFHLRLMVLSRNEAHGAHALRVFRNAPEQFRSDPKA
jgi:hypothetical protein